MKTQYEQASEIPTKDLVRHSLVSISNHHICSDCFCCAAFEVLGFRFPELRNLPTINGQLDYATLEGVLIAIGRSN